MSGAFHLEAPNGAAPFGGVRAGIFQPPTSPSVSSSMYLQQSTASLCSDLAAPVPNVKRKRRGTPPNRTVDQLRHPAAGGAGGREMRYMLGGQIETPDGAGRGQIGAMEDSTYSDIDYRRALGPKRPRGGPDSSPPLPPARMALTPAMGWSRLALETIGGVVGRVWEFCREGAFRGFYAGGGQGYALPPATPTGRVWCNEHDVPTLPEIPGGFPEPDPVSPSHWRETPESTPPPAAKRRQIFEGTPPRDELRKNWVMIDGPADKRRPAVLSSRATEALRPRPPTNRRISRPVGRLANPGITRQQSGRVSHAGGASLDNRRPASYASPRSPTAPEWSGTPRTPSRLPVPTRSHSPAPLLPHPTRIPSPSPQLQSRGSRRQTLSAASAASPLPNIAARTENRGGSVHGLAEETSPRLDAEARHMVARRMKQDRQTDARINDFNARLMDMIRQGKEALGTTVEVDSYDDLGGCELDTWEDD